MMNRGPLLYDAAVDEVQQSTKSHSHKVADPNGNHFSESIEIGASTNGNKMTLEKVISKRNSESSEVNRLTKVSEE